MSRPHAALAVAAVAAAAALVVLGGVPAAFVCCPVVILCYWQLAEPAASLLGVALLALTVAVANDRSGVPMAASLAASLGAEIVLLAALARRFRRVHGSLQQQAITDPLTGAFNRRHLETCLTTAVERRRRTGEHAALLLFDLDRFKDINDVAGHAAGDQVLADVAALVGRRIRKLDLLFRLGGDEFALLLAGVRLADAVRVAETVRTLIARARVGPGQRVSISIGVCELGDNHSPRRWYEQADAALYRAKRTGRNRTAGPSTARQLPAPGINPRAAAITRGDFGPYRAKEQNDEERDVWGVSGAGRNGGRGRSGEDGVEQRGTGDGRRQNVLGLS